jgi:hypothetical protein
MGSKHIEKMRNPIVHELYLRRRANPNMPHQLITQDNVHRFFTL